MTREGVWASGLGDQMDRDVTAEQECRRGSLFGMPSNAGVASTLAAEEEECRSWRQPAWD